MVGIETWALGLCAVAILGLFGHHLKLHADLARVADELAKFREHVATEYAHNGTLEKAITGMTAAFREFTAEFRTFQRDIHTGQIQLKAPK